jgi:hypothetical protein
MCLFSYAHTCLHACLCQKHKYAYKCILHHACLCMILITHSHTCVRLKSCIGHVYALLLIRTHVRAWMYAHALTERMYMFFFRLAHAYTDAHIRAHMLFVSASLISAYIPCMCVCPFYVRPNEHDIHTQLRMRLCSLAHVYTYTGVHMLRQACNSQQHLSMCVITRQGVCSYIVIQTMFGARVHAHRSACIHVCTREHMFPRSFSVCVYTRAARICLLASVRISRHVSAHTCPPSASPLALNLYMSSSA